MGLSYYYTFSAPASVKDSELTTFLNDVEKTAKVLGFHPTMVLNAKFDTEERKQFARRLTTGYPLSHEKLMGLPMLQPGQVWHHSPNHGDCRVIPESGVLLMVTDERGAEVVFGFFKYPKTLVDIHGKDVLGVDIGGDWFFRDFIDSPDPRYREIVKAFQEGGYIREVRDEYA